MAHTVDSRAGTPANELRDLLDAAERELPVLTSSSLLGFLLHLDQIDSVLAALANTADLRSEETRWQDLQARVTRRASKLVGMAAPLGGFTALRTAHLPAAGAWWHLDEWVAKQRWASLRRIGVALLVAAALLAVAAVIYQRFLAPSPETILVVDTIGRVEQLASDQNWAEALRTTEEALQTVPNDPDLLVAATVLSERLGNQGKAASYTARASQAMGDPLRFQLALGVRRIQMGDIDGAEQAAKAALALHPNEAQAVFILGNVAEARGQLAEAADYYNKAATLAEESNPQLTVISKMRLAALLQQQGFAPTSPTPAEASPTP